MPSLARKSLAAAFFLAALLLRLAAIAAIDPILGMNAEYVFLGGAERLVSGSGFADPSYPILSAPLYAVFIAIGLELFGDAQLPIKLAQAVADSLTVVLLYFICRRVFEERSCARRSGSCRRVSVLHLRSRLDRRGDVLHVLPGRLRLARPARDRIRSLVAAWRGGSPARAGDAGQGVGPVLSRLLAPDPLCALRSELGTRSRRFAAFGACFVLLIAPWTIRNYVLLGEFIPVAVNGGLPLLCGAGEEFFTIPGRQERMRDYYRQIAARGIDTPDGGATISEWERFYRRAAIERYKIRFETDPWSFPGFLLKKFARLWYGTESGSNQLPILLINAFIYPFCLAGIWSCVRRRQMKALILLMPVLYLVMLHWVTFVMFRYMVPVMPYLLAFAAVAVVACDRSIRRFERPRNEARTGV